MQVFRNNIVRTYGKDGQAWLEQMPALLDMTAKRWHLHSILPIENLTYNYLAKAVTKDNKPVVIKLCFKKTNLAQEMAALTKFNGHGAVKLLAFEPTTNAMLLQQAIPGNCLKALYAHQPKAVMGYYAGVVDHLKQANGQSDFEFPHIRDWLKAIDDLYQKNHPQHRLVSHGKQLKDKLLASLTNPLFIHGDLHQDNVIQHHDGWLAIDPHGAYGDVAYEIAAFDFLLPQELDQSGDLKLVLSPRIEQLAYLCGCDPERVADWLFVRLILKAAWQIEDNLDPSWAFRFAERLSER